MTDQTVVKAPELNFRQGQVIKVLQIMADGTSQAEACALVGISQRTYQRWVSKMNMGPALQQLAGDALTAAAVMAFNAFPAAVAYQVQIATGKAGDPRDANKSAVFLRDLAANFATGNAKVSKTTPQGDQVPVDDGETTSITLTFSPNFANKKFQVTAENDAPNIIDGELSETQPEQSPDTP